MLVLYFAFQFGDQLLSQRNCAFPCFSLIALAPANISGMVIKERSQFCFPRGAEHGHVRGFERALQRFGVDSEVPADSSDHARIGKLTETGILD